MVVMIVCHQKGIDRRKIDTMLAQSFSDYPWSQSGINQHSVVTVAQIVAITATTAAQAEKGKFIARKQVILHILMDKGSKNLDLPAKIVEVARDVLVQMHPVPSYHIMLMSRIYEEVGMPTTSD
jgi:hypothetical protein